MVSEQLTPSSPKGTRTGPDYLLFRSCGGLALACPLAAKPGLFDTPNWIPCASLVRLDWLMSPTSYSYISSLLSPSSNSDDALAHVKYRSGLSLYPSHPTLMVSDSVMGSPSSSMSNFIDIVHLKSPLCALVCIAIFQPDDIPIQDPASSSPCCPLPASVTPHTSQIPF